MLSSFALSGSVTAENSTGISVIVFTRACAEGVPIPRTKSFLSVLYPLAIKVAFAIVPSAFFSSKLAFIPASSKAFLNPCLTKSNEGCVAIWVIPIL